MKACFQIAECSFVSAKILQKKEITKRIATFFILSLVFFLAKSKYFSLNLLGINNYLYLSSIKG